MKTYPIQIDAQAAFKIIGVDLRVSPIAEECAEALHKHLEKCITTDLVIAALTDAGRASKSRRRRKTPGSAVANLKPEGQNE
ncbi:MAG: hypothetical protein ACSHX9_01555 [Luteolibacter sp.]